MNKKYTKKNGKRVSNIRFILGFVILIKTLTIIITPDLHKKSTTAKLVDLAEIVFFVGDLIFCKNNKTKVDVFPTMKKIYKKVLFFLFHSFVLRVQYIQMTKTKSTNNNNKNHLVLNI